MCKRFFSLSDFAHTQLFLNGYQVINKLSSQLAKLCMSRDDITWLAASRHSVEAYYEHTSAAITPSLRITYSGPDTGDNEVRLPLFILLICWVLEASKHVH
jgi:hypothetical protein